MKAKVLSEFVESLQAASNRETYTGCHIDRAARVSGRRWLETLCVDRARH